MENNPPSSEVATQSNEESSSSKSKTSFITCPYKNHEIYYTEFNNHVIECRQELLGDHIHSLDLVRCQYNSSHLLPKVEMEIHEAICQNRKYAQIQKELARPTLPIDVTDVINNMNKYTEDEDASMNRRRDRLEGKTQSTSSDHSDVTTDSDASSSDLDDDDVILGEQHTKLEELRLCFANHNVE